MRNITRIRGTAAEQVKQAIADALLLGELVPGDKLDEQALAERYEVSRTPVREALRQLAFSGLVELRPNRGAVVRQLEVDEAAALFEAAGELDALCARFASQRMTGIERKSLALLVEAGDIAVAAGDGEAFRTNNTAFHDTIYRGSHNDTLRDLARSTLTRSEPYRSAQFSALAADGRLASSQAQHAAILAAILRSDGGLAAELMRDHVATSGALVMSHLAVKT